jgi:heptose I phosphotransferase
VYLTLNTEISKLLPPEKRFDHIMQLRGEVFRELENRRTQRILLNAHPYFIKQHFGVGWKEIFKNLLQGRLPVISAKNEWQAIKLLEKLAIPTQEALGYGYRGINPATMQSFIITRELPKFITLEDLCKNWKQQAPTFCFKYNLIKKVAHIARTLHNNGINHRDFYICHFLLDLIEYEKVGAPENQSALKMYLIDLHRAQIRRRTPTRWIIKDLAGLYFSSKDIGLTQRDVLRFIKLYRKQSLREMLNKETTFWWKVKNRGDKLYRKHEH